MPSRMRHTLLISLVVISLIIISFKTSYPETVNYIYDELNRLIRVEYGDGTKIVYTYDEAGNRSQVYAGIYTLDVNVVGGGTVTKNPDQLVYSPGTSVTLTAVNGEGTFSEWSGDLTGNTNPTAIVMDGNKSVTATFATPLNWLQGWTYRKAVTLSRASGAVTNYQMKLLIGESSGTVGYDVHCNGHVLSSFNDLRFTASDGTTLLNYWIKSITGTTPNQLATVWIKFDSIGTGATTFYMYYGKAGASDVSNFDGTFIFGDPFDNASLNTTRWPSVDGTPAYSINTSNHYLEVTDMASSQWFTGKGFHSKAISLPDEWMIDDPYGNTGGFMLYEATTASAQLNMGAMALHHTSWSSSDYGIAFTVNMDPVSASQSWHIYSGVGGNVDYSTPTTAGASKTINSKIYKLSGNIHIDIDGTNRVNQANSETPIIFHLVIGRYLNTVFGTIQFGAFCIRSYANPEPTWGSWGTEEAY